MTTPSLPNPHVMLPRCALTMLFYSSTADVHKLLVAKVPAGGDEPAVLAARLRSLRARPPFGEDRSETKIFWKRGGSGTYYQAYSSNSENTGC